MGLGKDDSGCLIYAQDLKDPSCDGQQDVTVYYMKAVEVLKSMFGDPKNERRYQYSAPNCEFTKSGDRILSEISSGVYKQYGQEAAGNKCTIVGFTGYSDEAKCSDRPNCSTWGIYGKS